MSLEVKLTPESEKVIFEQFEEIGRRAIEHVKHELYSPKSRYVNQTELVKLFKTGMAQVIEWRKQGLKRVRIGKSWCYDIKDVYEIIDSNKQD